MSAPVLRLLVAHHDPSVLLAASRFVPSDATLLHLSSLSVPRVFSDNRYAEARVLMWMALNPDEALGDYTHVALFQASYPTKFDKLPSLHEVMDPEYKVYSYKHSDMRWAYEKGVVFGPLVVPDFLGQANSCHQHMDLSLERVFERCGITYDNARHGPMTTSLCAETSVWRRFLPDWLRLFVAAQDDAESLPYCTMVCKPGVEAAYLCERLATGWFTGQQDLDVCVMGAPTGDNEITAYTALYPNIRYYGAPGSA